MDLTSFAERSTTMANDRIIVVAPLTQSNLDALGPGFTRVWPVDDTPCFSQLLQRIDEADRDLQRERDAGASSAESPLNE